MTKKLKLKKQYQQINPSLNWATFAIFVYSQKKEMHQIEVTYCFISQTCNTIINANFEDALQITGRKTIDCSSQANQVKNHFSESNNVRIACEGTHKGQNFNFNHTWHSPIYFQHYATWRKSKKSNIFGYRIATQI